MTHRLLRRLTRFLRRSRRTDPASNEAVPPTPDTGARPLVTIPPAFQVERRTLCLADLDRAALRACIQDLDGRADELGCVVFDDGTPSDRVVVIFAGNGERFFMLAAARHVRAPVIYVQEPRSPWYQGSDLLPDIATLADAFLVPEIGTRLPFFFGQSSGGYAALVASSRFADATAVAVSPQTFSDRAAKASLCFVGVNAARVPDGLIDLRALFSRPGLARGVRLALFAASEAENPVHAHFWMDHLHAQRLLDLPSVTVYLLRTHNHAVAHQRLNRFADLLALLMPMLGGPPQERVDATSAWLHETFVEPG